MGRDRGPWGAEDTGLWALTLLFGPSVAVDRLPDFLAAPNAPRGQPLPHHQCSIHLNCEDTLLLHQAFEDAMDGLPSHRWGPWRHLSPWLETGGVVGRQGPRSFTTLAWEGPRAPSLPVWPGTGAWR